MLNLSVDRIYSIDAFSIALLKEFSQFGLPNKRVLTVLSSFSVKMFASIVAILSKGDIMNITSALLCKEWVKQFVFLFKIYNKLIIMN